MTGAKPSVTLPFGTSKLTLVVNDGEADSAPVAVNITVSDFAVALNQSSASLKRGQSTTLDVKVTSKSGSFDQPVIHGCANLPASMSCQFSPATVQPGASGANAVLTLTSSGLAQHQRTPRSLWAIWTGMFGIFGVVFVTGSKRGRRWTLLLIVLALTAISYISCGGGGAAMTSSSQNNVTPSTTVTITITGSSGGLQHSTTATVQVN